MLDAIVIGGGPAGSSAARLLARQGWQVVLVEHGPRHRRKACGDCLNQRAVFLLRRHGLLDDVKSLAVGATRRLRVHAWAREPLTASLDGPRATDGGLLVERHRFDQLLIDRAAADGVEVLQPATARIRVFEPRRVRVEIACGGRTHHLAARMVIGADGLRSAVARAAGLAALGYRSGGVRYGFAVEVRPAGGRARAIRPDTIEMFVVPRGYVGVVNKGGGELHVAGLATRPTRATTGPDVLLESAVERFALLRDAGLDQCGQVSRGRMIGAGPMPCRPCSVAGEHVALVGDAAGFVEPFTGEGMSWALESADALAAMVRKTQPGQWSLAAAARYRRAWAGCVGRRQRRCRVLTAALHRPVAGRVLFRLAAGHPLLVRHLVRQATMP